MSTSPSQKMFDDEGILGNTNDISTRITPIRKEIAPTELISRLTMESRHFIILLNYLNIHSPRNHSGISPILADIRGDQWRWQN